MFEYKNFAPTVLEHSVCGGRIDIIAGRSAAGKSTAALDKAVEHIREDPFNTVYWIDGEVLGRTIEDRIRQRHDMDSMFELKRLVVISRPGNVCDFIQEIKDAPHSTTWKRMFVFDGFFLGHSSFSQDDFYAELRELAEKNNDKFLLVVQLNSEIGEYSNE